MQEGTRNIGVTFDPEGNALVAVWAPLVESVALKISDENIVIPLKKSTEGYWTTLSDQIKPGDNYKFILNGNEEFPDPASVSQPEGVHGPSRAHNISNFKWTDQQWKNSLLEDYILYEIHTGTFSTHGDFKGIADKLDYLKNLGISAIEIMPVAQFPGERNWGYDGVFPFAVQHSYGGPESLQMLVDACHSKGISVVLDVVYNHIGPEGNYLGAFGPYFTSKYNTPWGNAINFDDVWCDGVRKYFIENVLMWFRDFHIDALRMDAVHAIKDFSAIHILQEIKQEVDNLKKITGKEHYLIVELDLNDTRFINPQSNHGFGMDAQWVDEFHHALRVTAGEPRIGYYEDFDGLKHLAKSYSDAYVYDGQYSPHRHKKFGVKASENSGSQFIVFSQNHDQVGNRMLGERSSQLVGFEMQKLFAAAVFISPYLPMLFMGEEYGELNPFLYFVNHSDSALIEAVRKGRKAEFAAFHTQGEAPDPQAETTFTQSKMQWSLLEKEPHKTLLQYYTRLIELRKMHPVLKRPDRKQMQVFIHEVPQTLVIHRWEAQNHVFCILNFSGTAQKIGIPKISKNSHLLFDSAAAAWLGPNKNSDNILSTSEIFIAPESMLIYANYYASACINIPYSI